LFNGQMCSDFVVRRCISFQNATQVGLPEHQKVIERFTSD
jgi:hypothetical protein